MFVEICRRGNISWQNHESNTSSLISWAHALHALVHRGDVVPQRGQVKKKKMRCKNREGWNWVGFCVLLVGTPFLLRVFKEDPENNYHFGGSPNKRLAHIELFRFPVTGLDRCLGGVKVGRLPLRNRSFEIPTTNPNHQLRAT